MDVYFTLFKNFLDVVIATFIIYQVLHFMFKSEKLILIVNAIIMITILYFLSNVLNLTIVETILSNVFSWGIVLIFILFQDEIRSAMEKLGGLDRGGAGGSGKGSDFINNFTNTVFGMAEDKVGALITFEGTMPLTKYTENAVKLNADYSSHLLESIFNKEGVLHDGSVVIKDQKIMYASTYFPISLSVNIDNKYGTRHRSALTLSSETDALVVIVSEERGTVSIAYKENLYTDLEKVFFIEFLSDKAN